MIQSDHYIELNSFFFFPLFYLVFLFISSNLLPFLYHSYCILFGVTFSTFIISEETVSSFLNCIDRAKFPTDQSHYFYQYILGIRTDFLLDNSILPHKRATN